MRKIIGYSLAAGAAVALYASGADPFWQMAYTVGIIAAIVITERVTAIDGSRERTH